MLTFTLWTKLSAANPRTTTLEATAAALNPRIAGSAATVATSGAAMPAARAAALPGNMAADAARAAPSSTARLLQLQAAVDELWQLVQAPTEDFVRSYIRQWIESIR